MQLPFCKTANDHPRWHHHQNYFGRFLGLLRDDATARPMVVAQRKQGMMTLTGIILAFIKKPMGWVYRLLNSERINLHPQSFQNLVLRLAACTLHPQQNKNRCAC